MIYELVLRNFNCSLEFVAQHLQQKYLCFHFFQIRHLHIEERQSNRMSWLKQKIFVIHPTTVWKRMLQKSIFCRNCKLLMFWLDTIFCMYAFVERRVYMYWTACTHVLNGVHLHPLASVVWCFLQVLIFSCYF